MKDKKNSKCDRCGHDKNKRNKFYEREKLQCRKKRCATICPNECNVPQTCGNVATVYYETPCGTIYQGPPPQSRESLCCNKGGPPPPAFYLPDSTTGQNQYIRMINQLSNVYSKLRMNNYKPS